jgi:hypothetical protein
MLPDDHHCLRRKDLRDFSIRGKEEEDAIAIDELN